MTPPAGRRLPSAKKEHGAGLITIGIYVSTKIHLPIFSMKKQESISAISRRTGVTPATLRAWRAAGVDLHNPAQLGEKIANRQPSKPTESGSATQAAKLRKLLAEAQLAEIRAATADAKLISIDEVCTCLTKIGHTLKAQLGKLRAELPPSIYGLSQAEMSKAITAHVDRTLQAICDELDRVKTEPPRPLD